MRSQRVSSNLGNAFALVVMISFLATVASANAQSPRKVDGALPDRVDIGDNTDLGDGLDPKSQKYRQGRRRPILASEWISTDFGRNPDALESLHSALDPKSSAAHRRGAFLDNMLQMIGESADASPEPTPRTAVNPITVSTLNGEHIIYPGAHASYLIAIYQPEDNYDQLWFRSPIDALFSTLPPTANVIFAVSASTPSPQDIITAMLKRCQGVPSFRSVQDRVHFLSAPLSTTACGVGIFPRCKGTGRNWIEDAVAGWGSMKPSVAAAYQRPGDAEPVLRRLDAAGDTGWLPPITDVARRNGAALTLPLVQWDGLACNASEHAGPDPAGKAVLIRRGVCTFFTKVASAAARGAAAVVIWSDSDRPEKLSCGPPDACGAAGLGIPAVAVGRGAGQELADAAAAGGDAAVALGAELSGECFLGVDHRARLREVGSIPLATAKERARAWGQLALEAVYYRYEQSLDRRLADPDALRVPVLTGAADGAPLLGGGGGIYADVVLPPRERMAQWDTLEVYLELGCPGAWDKTCGAWDYVVQLDLCTRPGETPAAPRAGRVDDARAAHASCTAEAARWVTAYGRPGRWLTDATAALPLLRGGGRQHVRLRQPEWSAQRYRATLTLLFRRAGKAGVPARSVFLFGGGAFDAGYNAAAARAPVRLDVAAGVTRVELHSVVSGHGWGTDADNCAEFCATEHGYAVRAALDAGGAFYVSRSAGAAWHNLTRAGADAGCAEQVGSGVTPNQYGTWRYGRAGWCPGGDVAPAVFDVTRHLTPGLEAVVTYHALLGGSEYAPRPCAGDGCAADGFAPTITLRASMVLYTDPRA